MKLLVEIRNVPSFQFSPGYKLDVGDTADVAEDPLDDGPLGEVDGVGELVGDPGAGPHARPAALVQLPPRPLPHAALAAIEPRRRAELAGNYPPGYF